MPWSQYLNNNVFSDRLNWPYGTLNSIFNHIEFSGMTVPVVSARSGGKLFHTGSSSCEGPVSETAGTHSLVSLPKLGRK